MGEAGAFPERVEDLLAMVPRDRARHGAGDLLRRRAPGRRADAAAGPALLELHAAGGWIFVVFGVVGFVWAVAWFRWFRDEPADHPDVSEAERKLHRIGPGGRPASTGSTPRGWAASCPTGT